MKKDANKATKRFTKEQEAFLKRTHLRVDANGVVLAPFTGLCLGLGKELEKRGLAYRRD